MRGHSLSQIADLMEAIGNTFIAVIGSIVKFFLWLKINQFLHRGINILLKSTSKTCFA
jgi:hypothetical protein